MIKAVNHCSFTQISEGYSYSFLKLNESKTELLFVSIPTDSHKFNSSSFITDCALLLVYASLERHCHYDCYADDT